MDFNSVFIDKSIKPKEKTEILSKSLLEDTHLIDELILFAKSAKDAVKATCIEAIEFATKANPAVGSLQCLEFATESLAEKAPRVKWESAKVIGNIAHRFPENLEQAIINLLINTEHPGTVVRWSAAFALGEIIKSRYGKVNELIPAIRTICDREKKNSIKKIYLAAIKKALK